MSTGAALWAHAVAEQRHLVWAPDTTGSVAFLVSGGLGIAAVTASAGLFAPGSREWQAQWVNMAGCVAFGASALGAFVTPAGVTADALLANTGTFVGALCFWAAALLVLPPGRCGGWCLACCDRGLPSGVGRRPVPPRSAISGRFCAAMCHRRSARSGADRGVPAPVLTVPTSGVPGGSAGDPRAVDPQG